MTIGFECKLAFECPKHWEQLDTTSQPDVRYCHTCKSPVYWVKTNEEFSQHAFAGHCVAFKDMAQNVLGIPINHREYLLVIKAQPLNAAQLVLLRQITQLNYPTLKQRLQIRDLSMRYDPTLHHTLEAAGIVATQEWEYAYQQRPIPQADD